jgi:hypothetical protein
MSGITLLKEWLSPEQLAQFESHSFFDVIGKHSGKPTAFVTALK